MIQVHYTRFNSRFSDTKWHFYLGMLPEILRGQTARYKRWQDRQANLLGKLLLMECLLQCGYSSDGLNRILYDEYSRPYIEGDIDFNISHSGEYALCAITDKGKVGIDIERIKPIDPSDFEQYMTPEQSEKVKEAANGWRIFYEYWTIKESVLKADGRGLSIPISEINAVGNKAILYENTWFLREINIDPDYSCHLATNIENPEIHIKEIKFQQ